MSGARGTSPSPPRSGQGTRGLRTGQTHRLLRERVAIPVVLVPGIMGSRLGVAGGQKVWDPDAAGFMLRNYLPARGYAARRKQFLLGDNPDAEGRFEVLNFDAEHNRGLKLTSRQVDGGWGGVSFSSYGDILKALSTLSLSPRLPNEYRGAPAEMWAPVYAFGYDWTGSCKAAGVKLKEQIANILQVTRAEGWTVPGVIVVTHSMGGIVTRSACQQGAAGNVLGVVHGVQPATGAPAAYWRMKAGMPSVPMFSLVSYLGAGVLGNDGRDVTAILGNIRGGLELLPTFDYTVDGSDRGWLRWPTDDDGGMRRLPEGGDPYTSIYLNDQDPWRLIDNPEFLTPEARPASGRFRRPDRFGSVAWRTFKVRMGLVRDFHTGLRLYQHPRTFHFYSTGLTTSDHIAFTREETFARTPGQMPDRDSVYWSSPTAENLAQGLSDRESNVGEYVRWVPIPHEGRTDYNVRFVLAPLLNSRIASYTLGQPGGGGDGTVPSSSGGALLGRPGTLGRRVLSGVEHEGAYRDGSAQDFTLASVVSLVRQAARAS